MKTAARSTCTTGWKSLKETAPRAMTRLFLAVNRSRSKEMASRNLFSASPYAPRLSFEMPQLFRIGACSIVSERACL